MPLFDSPFIATFSLLAIAHFMALLSPGPDFFLITSHAMRHRLRGSGYICLGVALGNGVYIAIALMGWMGIRDNPLIFSLIKGLGACYLLWMGAELLRSRAEALTSTKAFQRPMLTIKKQCLIGLGSALANPKNALFYISLMSLILGPTVSLAQQLFCAAWMFCVVLFWDLLIAFLVGHSRLRRLMDQKIDLFERSAGAVLICFAAGLVMF